MLRVLHVISSLDPVHGGPVEVVKQLDQVWREQSLATSVVACLDDPNDPFLASYPFKVTALSGRSPLARLPGARRYGYSERLVPWLRANASRFDAVIVHGLWNYASFASAQALTDRRTPVFVFTHGMLDPWFRRTYPLKHLAKQLFWWLGEGPLMSRARKVLFTCEEERRVAAGAFLGHNRYAGLVVGLGIAAPPPRLPTFEGAFRQAVPALGRRPFQLFFGRLHPKKGCDLLVEAFCREAVAEDVDLVVAGPDQAELTPALAEIARGHGMADRVHFPGPLYGEAKWGALYGAEVFALSSHQENFGIAVAEALGCGTPVLISDKVNIWREIEDADAGLVRPDTLTGTSALLAAWVATSADRRQIMSDNARQLFATAFDVQRTGPALVETLRAGS